MNLSAASPLFPLLYLPPAGESRFSKWHWQKISCFAVAFVAVTFLALSLGFTNAASLTIGPTPPRQHLASTQDLLSRLQLLPAYDKYVRPPQSSLDGPLDVKPNLNGGGNTNTQLPNPMSPLIDKGKGREVPVRGGDVDMHDPNDGDEDDVGGKKKRNNYKHLIRGIPGKSDMNHRRIICGCFIFFSWSGKHSMKKDDYLEKMMLVPPKQRIRIRRFDERTQEDAFSVTLEGLKGVCSILFHLDS
jgi:hypothetical protein